MIGFPLALSTTEVVSYELAAASTVVTTSQMGDAVVRELQTLASR